MNITTLEKANQLNQEIKSLELFKKKTIGLMDCDPLDIEISYSLFSERRKDVQLGMLSAFDSKVSDRLKENIIKQIDDEIAIVKQEIESL